MISAVKISDFIIGPGHSPFIVAEMSGNHNQSIDEALQLVDAAAEAGAHGLKIQTYTADTMTIPGVARIEDPKSPWHGRSLYELYTEAHTPWEWHQAIFERAHKKGLVAFSTPFDVTAVDFLEELSVPVYKIASFESCDWALLRKVATTRKPVILSTGATPLGDLIDSVQLLHDSGCQDLILLKCTSSYPAQPSDANILTIPHMQDLFDSPVGLSDHTLGIGVAVASVALGACLIEKHLCLSRDAGGVDSSFSMEPEEFKLLVQESERAFQGLGSVQYQVQENEKGGLVFKRSLYAVEDIPEGEKLTEANVRALRPGYGLAPRHLDSVLGKTAIEPISKGTPIRWTLLRDIPND